MPGVLHKLQQLRSEGKAREAAKLLAATQEHQAKAEACGHCHCVPTQVASAEGVRAFPRMGQPGCVNVVK